MRQFLSGLSESAFKTLLNEQTVRQMPVQIISRRSSTSISQSSDILENYCENNDIGSARDSLNDPILPISVGCVDLNNYDDRQTSIENILRQPYDWWKRLNVVYNNRRSVFLSTGPFKLWLSDDPDTNDQFPLEIPVSTSETKSMKQNFAIKLAVNNNRHQPKGLVESDTVSGQNYVDLNLRPAKKICTNNDCID